MSDSNTPKVIQQLEAELRGVELEPRRATIRFLLAMLAFAEHVPGCAEATFALNVMEKFQSSSPELAIQYPTFFMGLMRYILVIGQQVPGLNAEMQKMILVLFAEAPTPVGETLQTFLARELGVEGSEDIILFSKRNGMMTTELAGLVIAGALQLAEDFVLYPESPIESKHVLELIGLYYQRKDWRIGSEEGDTVMVFSGTGELDGAVTVSNHTSERDPVLMVKVARF